MKIDKEEEMVEETLIQRAERKMCEDYDGYPHTVAIREVFLTYLDKELAELYTVMPNGSIMMEGKTYDRVWKRRDESPKYKAKTAPVK